MYKFRSNLFRKVESSINVLRVIVRQQSVNLQVLKKNNSPQHVPVMRDEVLKFLDLKPNNVFIDMTFGAGGHTRAILESSPNTIVYCLDRDPTAYSNAIELEKSYPTQVIPLLGKFSDLPKLLENHKVAPSSIDGILFDFGCSSMQFDNAERGFSVSKDGPLDMRMDGAVSLDTPTAADVLATADEADLYKIFKIYGEEKKARKIARAIVETRYTFTTLQTTKELGDFVSQVLQNETRVDKLKRPAHVATKVFQALRIFVNNELNEINYGLIVAHRYLKSGGRLVTITFHSLEDCIVKRHFTGNISDNTINVLPLQYVSFNTCHDSETMEQLASLNWKSMTKHVVTPSQAEINENPRSRSAKLRAATKVK